MIELMGKQYDLERYHCVHFAMDVWERITGEDLRELFQPLLAAPGGRCVAPDFGDHFKALDKPESPCIVVMRQQGREPHMGVFWKGRVIHLQETGAMAITPDRLSAMDVRYYRCTP